MSKILVTDDEANIRLVVKEYAEFEGYEVDEAENGMQAIDMVKNNNYDLVIMDVMMPKLDGYSACKEIKKIKKPDSSRHFLHFRKKKCSNISKSYERVSPAPWAKI